IDAGQILGGYRLAERIGRGRLGDVWLAQNVHVEAMLRAIKIVHPELASDPDFRKRFLEEAALLDALKHDNIVQAMSVRDEGGTPHQPEPSEDRTDPQVVPDAIAGAPPSPAGDVHALGKALFELVAGTPPAVSARLKQLKPEVPDELDALIHRAMAPAPRERP